MNAFRKLYPIFLILLAGIQVIVAEENIDYQLSNGDVVSVRVYGQADLAATLEIDGEGTINLGLIGRTKISGMSVDEAERAIRSKYIDERFLRDPNVVVSIVKYSPRNATIKGPVVRPGTVDLSRYPKGLDIETVIALAGGFKNIAKESAIQLFRKGANGEQEVFTLDLSSRTKAKNKDHKDGQFKVFPGDLINVLETVF
ncbi:polysaccharide export protein [Puniceicoccaceae bacterium K14]|nr:polysaccharide export protein [Puniceicoccaceae bacterium K14]